MSDVVRRVERPESVTLDELCRYVRALGGSRLESASLGPAGRLDLAFGGRADVPTRAYVWTDGPTGPEEREVAVPAFRDGASVRVEPLDARPPVTRR